MSGDTPDIGATGRPDAACRKVPEGDIGDLGREGVDHRVDERSAVTDGRPEDPDDARHAAGHVEVHVDPLGGPLPAADGRGPFVQQDRTAEQVEDDVTPRA